MYRIERPLLYLVLLVLLLFEALTSSLTAFNQIRPDLYLVLTVFFGLFYGITIGIECGLICGFINDILGTGVFGSNMLIFGLLGLICGAVSEKVYKENFLVQMLITFTASLFISNFLLLRSISTAVIAPVVILILRFSLGHFSLSSFRR
ncbi:MAG: rod shape-determining protein MreD, partial [Candidatus Omnitrophica bacterium]|nr:rod shape-determining protein MreD [Candidatus Omnitrophota bacterium]